MGALDTFIANAPVGLVGVGFIIIIAVLSAAAVAGKRDSLAQQSADDGEAPRG